MTVVLFVRRLVCDSYIDASYMVAFFFPIMLIVVCTIYAILTRKIPEAFNESKHIGFTMVIQSLIESPNSKVNPDIYFPSLALNQYTTCVIWLAFVPLYFATANHVPLRYISDRSMFVQVIQFKLFSQNNINVCNNKFIRPRLYGLPLHAEGKCLVLVTASGNVSPSFMLIEFF